MCTIISIAKIHLQFQIKPGLQGCIATLSPPLDRPPGLCPGPAGDLSGPQTLCLTRNKTLVTALDHWPLVTNNLHTIFYCHISHQEWFVIKQYYMYEKTKKPALYINEVQRGRWQLWRTCIFPLFWWWWRIYDFFFHFQSRELNCISSVLTFLI